MGALEFYKVEMYFVTKSNLLEVIVKNCMKLLEPVADHKLRLYRCNLRNFLDSTSLGRVVHYDRRVLCNIGQW